ncbi:hypothetical protein AAVH_08157 [Aphelenchoides avenae]|nr:hypothetical protein AAVH_08157 [Aphelenchus avenae]
MSDKQQRCEECHRGKDRQQAGGGQPQLGEDEGTHTSQTGHKPNVPNEPRAQDTARPKLGEDEGTHIE